MNNANAAGFVCLGLAMGMLPVLAPGWFPPAAIDGSSARALWLEFMGVLQLLVGGGFLLRAILASAMEGVRNLADQRGAVATGDWQPDASAPNLVIVDFGTPEPAHAALALRRAHAISGRAVSFAGDAAARWLALGSAAEARVTNLVGRPANFEQAA
jgi:hypothetical protein